MKNPQTPITLPQEGTLKLRQMAVIIAQRTSQIINIMVGLYIVIMYMWMYGDGNKHQSIMKDIENIAFSSLVQISLGGNDLTSIECICRISMPKLQVIRLNDNRIRSARSITKCNWKLTQFNITNNPIPSLSQFSRVAADNLVLMGIEYENNPPLSHDLKWLFKLRTSNLRIIWMENKRRIMGEETRETLMRKFPNLFLRRVSSRTK